MSQTERLLAIQVDADTRSLRLMWDLSMVHPDVLNQVRDPVVEAIAALSLTEESFARDELSRCLSVLRDLMGIASERRAALLKESSQ